MKKDKMYFSVSEDYTKFVGVSGSQEGVVFPILIDGTQNNFHVTAYFKENDKEYYFNVHLTNQSNDKHIPLFSATVSKDAVNEFGKKCEEFARIMISLINKRKTPIKEINRKELFCINCLFEKNKLPNKYSKAKVFWKTLDSTSDIALISKHLDCTNENHNLYYNKKKKMLICKKKNGTYFGFKNINRLINESANLMSKHFFKEMKLLLKIRNVIVAAAQKEVLSG